MVQAQTDPVHCNSYSLAERFREFFGVFNMSDRADSVRLGNYSSNEPNSNGRLAEPLPSSKSNFMMHTDKPPVLLQAKEDKPGAPRRRQKR